MSTVFRRSRACRSNLIETVSKQVILQGLLFLTFSDNSERPHNPASAHNRILSSFLGSGAHSVGARTAGWTSGFLRWTLLAIAAAYVAEYLAIVFLRVRYPFELEWLEGSLVEHIRRILSGQKIYVRPSLEFVPYFYTPLYFYVSALVSHVVGLGLFPLRLVSFTSSIGCFMIIFLFVKREAGNVYGAVLASCLFAATFRIGGAWFDIARVDSLFLFLLLLGLYFVRFGTSVKSYVLAGIFLSLSFLTKQTALVVAFPIMLHCIYWNRRHAAYFIAVFLWIAGLTTVILDLIHDGWYIYYIFLVQARHAFRMYWLIGYWTEDIFGHLFIACIMSALCLYSLYSASQKRSASFYSLMTIGMVGAAWMSRLHEGGYDNVLLPAYAAIAILFGLAVHAVLRMIEFGPGYPLNKLLEMAVYIACITQFASLYYDPRSQIPTQEDLQAGWRFIEALSQIEGEVFVAHHPYLSVLAGKKSHAHLEAISEVVGSDKEQKDKLRNEIAHAMRTKRFSMILMDSFPDGRAEYSAHLFRSVPPAAYEGYCVGKQRFFDSESAFWPVTGATVRPELVIYRCPEG